MRFAAALIQASCQVGSHQGLLVLVGLYQEDFGPLSWVASLVLSTQPLEGVVSLVERVSRHAGVDIPLGSLVDNASAQRRQLAAAMEARPEARAMVERYEQAAESQGLSASGQDIADEIERFLKDQAEGL